jgi:methylmalonyl-CoA mutase N-terminal domain/subunit
MDALDRVAAGRDNLMPAIVDAVRSYVTLGEIADVLRRRFDEYRPQVAV